MRRIVPAVVLAACVCGAAIAEAREKSISELPKDAWTIACLWAEPLKPVGALPRRSTVSDFWVAWLNGSMQSVRRSANRLFFQGDSPTFAPEPGNPLRGAS